MYCRVICVTLFLFISDAALGTVITVDYKCGDRDSSACEISEVRVTPCGPAKGNQQRCKVKSGSNATIEADYIPHFDADKLSTQAFANVVTEIPMPGMDQDGCKLNKCPIKSGAKSLYKNILSVAEYFPDGNYNIKIRWWDEKDSKKGCCVALKVTLS